MKQSRLSQPMISQFFYDIFLVSFGGYMFALAMESLKAGTVVRYFNLNYLLIVVVLSGILSIILPHPVQSAPKKTIQWYFIGLILLSLALGFIVFQITASMGAWAYIAAISCGLLLCVSGIILQKDN